MKYEIPTKRRKSGRTWKQIMSDGSYYEATPEEIKRAELFFAQDTANKDRIRNQRHG